MTSMVSWLLGAEPRAGGLDPLDDRYYQQGTLSLSRSGVFVSPDSAMRASAVYRCVSILANVLAMFPKGMFEHMERGRRAAPEHPLHPIISFRPNKRQNAFEFWRQVCYSLVLRQNAYVQILPGSAGKGWVGGLVPLHPDRVQGPEELSDGRLRYVYTLPGTAGTVKMIGGDDMWHLTGLSSDGLKGLSMLDVANDSIGLSLAAERHASRFFERGVKLAGILQHEKTLKPETANAMSESFRRVYGGESAVGGVPVLWEGMKFNPISMTLKDAEFLDSRKFSVSEIARWFGVPPHMVGDVERSTSWGTGIEQQGLHFLIYSLLPWIELLEQSIRFTLVVQPERFYPKFNVNAILRMDAKAQADVFAVLIDKGILNPNECRELLERNPRAGGDDYVDVAKPQTVTVQPEEPAPEDDEEEDEEPEEDEPAQALAVARAIAQSRARELLEEERGHIIRLVQQHSKDQTEPWIRAVGRFYGHFAKRVAQAMACEKGAAKEWCEARRGLLLSESLDMLSREQEAIDTLVSLSLRAGG